VPTLGPVTKPESLRVLRLIARLNVGGPALHVSYLTRGLVERGYETTLVAGRVGATEGSMEYAAEELGVRPLFLPELQRDIAAGPDFGAVLHVRDLIRSIRPHVLHTHTAKAGAVGRMAAMIARVPDPPVVVHTFHGHVLHGYFDAARTRAFREVERALARRTDALIAVSPEVRDELVAAGIAPQSKFEVIRLGLDLDRRADATPEQGAALRAELGVPQASHLIAWLGRMTEIKRVDDLIRAVALLVARGDDVQLALAGDGPLRTSLESLVAELGIDERTHFLGMRDNVAPIYSAADVVALTSANEGTPVTLIEALASGTATVSTDVGGVRDVVRDGESGLLVPAGDVGGIATALERLVGDDELRHRFGAYGRVDVRGKYAVDRLLDDVDQLYRRLLERQRAQRALTSRVGALTPTLPKLSVGKADRRLRIALLSQYFPPEVGATQSRMQAFAEYLTARGHQVTVICEFPNHPHGVIPESYRGRLYEDDRSNPYRVLRVWVRAAREKTQRTRMNFYLSYMATATSVAPLLGRVDVVVATSPPLFSGAAGWALARLNRAPFVLDVRDLWPAAAVSLDQIPSTKAVAAGERLERFLYRHAAAVTAVTEPFCRHIDAIRGKPPKSALVLNGTLDMFFDIGFDPAARRGLGVPDDAFLATFAGTLGIAQALPSVLDAAELAGDDIHFALVGDGPVRDVIAESVRRRELANVHLHPQVPLDHVVPFLAASDALLVPLSAHPTFRDFVPSKLIDFMATGHAVVVSAAGEAADLVRKAEGGLVVPPQDPEALVHALRALRENPGLGERLGASARAFAASRLRSSQAAHLEDVVLEAVAAHA
jgi:glycosyltransferase involved in cell wall biosynthesis